MMKNKLGIFCVVANVLVLIANLSLPAWAQSVSGAFDILARTYMTNFPVPSFRPTQANKIIALDVYPNGTPAPNSDNGFAWIDACDADLLNANGNVPVTCARMGIKPDRVEFGSRNFDGGAQKDIYIVRGSQVVAKFTSTGLRVYGTVTADNFSNP